MANANLLVGMPTIYIGPTGEPQPEIDNLEPPAIVIGAVGGNWVQVSETEDDFVVSYVPTHDIKKTNQYTGGRVAVLTDEDPTATFTISEADLLAYSHAINAATLSTVAAGADQTAQDILKVGGGSITELAILAIGTSPEGGTRMLTCWRCYQSGTGDITNAKGVYVGTQAEFMLLTDDTQAAGEELFQYKDVTAVASS